MATIEDWLEGNVRIIGRQRPNIFFQCPSCGTTKLKCSIHIRKGIGRCYRASCSLHSGFSFTRLISIVQKCTWDRAIDVASQFQDEIEESYKPRVSLYPRDYPKNSLPFENLVSVAHMEGDREKLSLVTNALQYLVNSRGLTLDQITEYRIGIGYEDFAVTSEEGVKKVPRYGMIVVPIYFNGELVSYTSRSLEIDGIRLNTVKHYNARSGEDYVPAGQILFNFDTAIEKARESGILVIVEDVWSAIKLGNAVGTIGSNLSPDQIHLLVINWKGPIAICRDNDLGGNTAAAQDLEKLSGFYEDVRIVVPSGIDPDDDLEETKRRIRTSSPSNPFQSNILNILKR